MHFLSDEVIIRILGFLRPRDLCACSRVCSRWHRLANDPCIWRRLFVSTYGKLLTHRKKDASIVLRKWKELFILKTNWYRGNCNVQSLTYSCSSVSSFEPSNSAVICLKISNCERSILASVNAGDTKVLIWDLKERTQIHTVHCEDVVECVFFGMDRSVDILAIGLQNGKFSLWSNTARRIVHTQNNNIPNASDSFIRVHDADEPVENEHAVCRIHIQDNKLVTVTRACVVRLWKISWTNDQVKSCLCLHVLTTFKPRCSVLDIQLRRDSRTMKHTANLSKAWPNLSKRKADVWVLCLSYSSEVSNESHLIGCQMFYFHGGRLIERHNEVPTSLSLGSQFKPKKLHGGKFNRLLLEEMSSRTPISCLSISPCTRMVTSGQHDNTISLWETSSKSRRHTLFGHTGAVTCTHVDKHKVVSGSKDRRVKVWSVETGNCQLTLPGNHCSGVSSVTFNDQWVVSGDNSGEIKVWDFAVNSLLTLHSSTV